MAPEEPGAESALRSMAERYRRPDWVRRLNAMADSVGGDARRLVPIDAAALLAEAERSLGAHHDRRLRRSGLAGALRAARRRDRRLDDARRRAADDAVRSCCARCAHASCWHASSTTKPRIASERVAAPIIVTGPARSGHDDPVRAAVRSIPRCARRSRARRCIRCRVAPPESCGERRAWSECEQELWADVQPEFAAIHELRSDLPVECVTLTMPSLLRAALADGRAARAAGHPDVDVNVRLPPPHPAGDAARRAAADLAAEDARPSDDARSAVRDLPRRLDRADASRSGEDDAVDGQHDGDGAVDAHRSRRRARARRTRSRWPSRRR